MQAERGRQTGGDEVKTPAEQARARGEGAARSRKRRFVEPALTRHAPLTRITLVSDFDGSGDGSAGGTFFG